MINFYKYHGAGNDFIMINNLFGKISISPKMVKFLCNRHLGIGADGIISLEWSDDFECFMNYYNSDGTIAEMCGNGIMCTTEFYLKENKSKRESLLIDTRAGVKKIKVLPDGTYSVNMGRAVFKHIDFPDSPLNLEGIDFNFASMGNPHAVGFVDSLGKYDLSKIGPIIEKDEHFPNKINVELVEKVDDDYYKVKVWERGCGETLSCGTGACAVFSILANLTNEHNLMGKEIVLEFPGGKLLLTENDNKEIILRGNANFVFKGEIEEEKYL